MKSLAALLLMCLSLATSGVARLSESTPSSARDESTPHSAVRFGAVNIFIDPRGKPLAAYQFELVAHGAEVTLVGLGGGSHPAFSEPPYYDKRALLTKRIVIAAYSTSSNLPTGPTHVATLMVRVSGPGEPKYAVRLHLAASSDAQKIPAQLTVTEGAP